ncbi:MAG: hypothetical protein NC829_02895, partial [Candidatus Omnitrophica bacterium]|nr:hypothetical protein [Candidatus Omnitrophota bacterium]
MSRLKIKITKPNFFSFAIYVLILFWILDFGFCHFSFAQEEKIPILVDGDQLEYSQVRREVTAQGHVVVSYKDSKLICDKATVNLLTKDCLAQGRVRLVDPRGEVEAESLLYNFDTRTGELLEAKIITEPVFGRGAKIKRLSEKEYLAENGFTTTCSYDKPHFRIQAKKVQFYPGDKVKAKDLVLYIGKVPVFYFPGFAKSLKDTVTPVQLQPGKNKDWGYYLLSGWRVNFTEKLRGRFLFDAREKLGTAQGFGLNYSETALGKGDFKFYYTHEKPDEPLADGSDEFERYLVRLRHIWQIDDANQITAEFYKIKDSKIKHDSQANFLKDYFYREFEKDQQPKTYLLYNHIFPNSSFNFFIQKRTTAFFEQIEKLPEASYILPAYQIGTTPLYFKTETSFSNLRNRGLEIIPSDDLISRFDTYNQLFLPFKLSFLNINPYVGLRETTYSRDINNDSIKDRTAFYSGAELSTKFFRAFSKGLRHIINPAIKYAYNSKPTVGRWRIIPFDSIDTLDSTNKL